MIFMTQKQFDRKVDRIMIERDERARMYNRMNDLERKIDRVNEKMYALQMKIDPEFRRQNTPVCGSGMTTMEPEQF